MKKRSFAANYLFNLSYQVLGIALPLVTTPYLSRVLGAGGIGRYSFVQSVVSYFALAAALGTTLYGQRAIARVRDDPIARTRVFGEILCLRAIGAVTAVAIYTLAILPAASDRTLYLVAGMEILAVAADISWLYQGMEDFRPIALCTAVGRLFAIVAVFLFVRDRGDLTVYALCYGASLLFGSLLAWGGARRYLTRIPWRRLRVFRHTLPSLSLFASQFAIQMYTVLDKTMIGLITHSELENGYYEQSQRLIKVLVAIVTSVGAVAASRVAVLWREGKRESAYARVLSSFRFVLALGLPMAVGCLLIVTRFVPVFYGEGFAPVVPIVRVLVWLFPVLGCSNVVGIQLLVPTGREGRLTLSVAVGAGVNLLLNTVLIRAYGAMGAAIASVAAECAVTGVQFFAVRRELPLVRVLRLFLRYALLSTVIGGVGLMLSRFAAEGLLGIFQITLPCALVYVLLLLALRDPVWRVLR